MIGKIPVSKQVLLAMKLSSPIPYHKSYLFSPDENFRIEITSIQDPMEGSVANNVTSIIIFSSGDHCEKQTSRIKEICCICSRNAAIAS